jgi:GGDEF domain-containing protein
MVEIEAAGGSGAAPDLETTTALLQEAGRLLQNRAQGEDIACRYGTRQLTLILLDSPPEATRARAEELRAALAGLSAPGAAPAPRCEFFLGTADFPEHGPDATHLLRTAADALRRDREAWGAEPRSGA